MNQIAKDAQEKKPEQKEEKTEKEVKEEEGGEKKSKLSTRHKLFCKLYASDQEFFGNGVKSYLKVYSTKKKRISYEVAKSAAYRLLTNVHILEEIEKLMDIKINDIVVDKELAFTILQKGHLPAKVQAIREYNKLKQRIVDKLEHTMPSNLIAILEKAFHNEPTKEPDKKAGDKT